MDDITGTPSPATAPVPFREDCWTEEATYTLVEAWGDRYLELNRGSLRQKHWSEVADAVNDRHGHVKKQRRTDIQCKNRIDTLKKKYKVEKAKVSESNGAYVSQWSLFARLESLLGSNFPASKPSPQGGGHRIKQPGWALTPTVPVGPRSVTQKRPARMPSPLAVDDSYSRRNLSAFAAAAAAAAEAEAEARIAGDEGSEGSSSRSSHGSRRKYRVAGRKTGKDREGDREREIGYRELAQAIERFGKTYERMEGAKQRQMVELEKQRMQFAKDLEQHRMQLFMETQVQLQRIKRTKWASGAGGTWESCLLPCYSYYQEYELLTKSFFM